MSAAAIVMLAGACCMWWGCCDCFCHEPPSVEQYIGSLSVQSDAFCTDSSTHAIPAEFEGLTYRFGTPTYALQHPMVARPAMVTHTYIYVEYCWLPCPE